MASVKIEPLKFESAPLVHALARRCFQDAWAEKDFLFFLTGTSSYTLGAWDERNELVGYFIGLKVENEIDVVTLGTHPDRRRQGIARALFTQVQRDTEIDSMVLEVDENNTAAVSLYKSLGFVVRGVRKKYYQGKFDALQMTWSR